MKWSWSSVPTSSWTQWILPVKRLVRAVVAGAHGGAGLVADVGGLVGGEDHGLRRSDPARPHRGAVVEQRDVAALGQSAAVVRELHPDLVLAGRHGLVGGDRRTPGCRGRCTCTSAGPSSTHTLQPPNRPPCAMSTPGPATGDVDLGGDGVGPVLHADDAVLGQPAHAGEEQLRVPADQGRPPGRSTGSSRSEVRSSMGSTLYFVASMSQSRCSLASRSGRSAARSWAWLKSMRAVVELPDVVVERGHHAADHDPGRAVLGDRAPALVVDPAVAEHLEVLQVVPLRGVGVVERVEHGRALYGRLLHAVDHRRLGQPGGLQDRSGPRR